MTKQRPFNAERRIADAFAHREGDRVPLWGMLCHRPIYERLLGAAAVGNAVDVPLEEKLASHARVYRELGIDMTRAQLWPPDRGAPPEEATVWQPHAASAADVASYRPDLPDDAARDQAAVIFRMQIDANSPHTVFAPTVRGVFCPVFERMGLEEFSYACADSPREIERLMDLHTEYARSMAERVAALPQAAYAVVADDMAYKGGLMFPPAWMRTHWLPRIARVIEPLKRAGLKVIYHSDGNIEALLADLIGVGVDAINPLEPLAGMDIGRIKRQFGADLTLIGGVDCAELLTFGRPEQVRDAVRRLIDLAAPGGGFIIGDSSQVMPDTPTENLLAFYETVHG